MSIADVIDAFKESLPKLSWMDTNSSTAAAEKASLLPCPPLTSGAN
jgi:hypothetical protein